MHYLPRSRAHERLCVDPANGEAIRLSKARAFLHRPGPTRIHSLLRLFTTSPDESFEGLEAGSLFFGGGGEE